MRRVHVIGGKNQGKTTLIVDLVHALTTQGLRVGTIKHTHHHHELDTPGKDSHRHRESGAAVVAICSPTMNAAFWPRPSNAIATDASSEGKYTQFAAVFNDCDLVLVEGDTHTSAPKIEVWRREVGKEPLAETDPTISAIVTDDSVRTTHMTVIWPRCAIEVVARNLLALVPSG
jgi:molybdopterin-guanine dinucleotide biosynthesis protein MobB